MSQFFQVILRDVSTNENIDLSIPSGFPSPIFILDDGWSPAITTYIRNGEKTWSDVIEELDCITNVATRDEALSLLEKINALIHRAARDIEEKQQYTVAFFVKSQFSTAPNAAFTYVISPPDDGNVITLSTDIQTAPPGQIKFRLRFKRTGAWITTFNDTVHTGTLTSDINPPSGYWKLQTTLPTNITIPTPISLSFSFTANGTSSVNAEQLFICVNVINTYLILDFNWDPPFDMDIVFYPSWRLAYGNYGYVIRDNTDSYTTDKRPYTLVNIEPGTYAVFVSWRSVQPNVSHRLQIQFDNNTETSNILLFAADTNPHYCYVGTVTTTAKANILYLRTTVGHSTGFEIEKIMFVRLKETSTIVNLFDWYFTKNSTITIQNSVLKPIKNVEKSWTINTVQMKELLLTYDSVDIIADSQSLQIVAVGNSPNVFSFRTETDYQTVYTLPTTITYRNIRTTFH